MLIALIGVAIFSTTLPMTRLAIREFDAVWLALARVEIAAVAAIIMLRLYRVPWPDKTHLPALLLPTIWQTPERLASASWQSWGALL